MKPLFFIFLNPELQLLLQSVVELGTRVLEEDVLPLTIVYLGVLVYPFRFHRPG